MPTDPDTGPRRASNPDCPTWGRCSAGRGLAAWEAHRRGKFCRAGGHCFPCLGNWLFLLLGAALLLETVVFVFCGCITNCHTPGGLKGPPLTCHRSGAAQGAGSGHRGGNGASAGGGSGLGPCPSPCALAGAGRPQLPGPSPVAADMALLSARPAGLLPLTAPLTSQRELCSQRPATGSGQQTLLFFFYVFLLI